MAEQPALNRSIGVRLSGAPPLDIVGRFDLAPRGSAHTCALLFENSCDEKTGALPTRARVRLLRAARHGCPSCPRTHLARRPDCRSGEEGSIPFAGADCFTVPRTHPHRILPRGHTAPYPDATRSDRAGSSSLSCRICRLWFTKPIALGSTPSRETTFKSPIHPDATRVTPEPAPCPDGSSGIGVRSRSFLVRLQAGRLEELQLTPIKPENRK